MARFASGLIVTEALFQRQVSVTMGFEPSIGIMARRFDKFGLDIRSMREPLQRSVKNVVIPSIRANFDAEGRPSWEYLTEKYAARRGSDHPILNVTGALRRVATQMNIWSIDQEKAMITDLPDNVWYGKVHQAGATFRTSGSAFAAGGVTSQILGRTLGQADGGGDGEIPARPFIMLQEQDLDDIDREFNEWLGERARAAGL
jgi:phage gpG-like protein